MNTPEPTALGALDRIAARAAGVIAPGSINARLPTLFEPHAPIRHVDDTTDAPPSAHRDAGPLDPVETALPPPIGKGRRQPAASWQSDPEAATVRSRATPVATRPDRREDAAAARPAPASEHPDDDSVNPGDSAPPLPRQASPLALPRPQAAAAVDGRARTVEASARTTEPAGNMGSPAPAPMVPGIPFRAPRQNDAAFATPRDRAPLPQTEQQGDPNPTIAITIGRIEIRAATPAVVTRPVPVGRAAAGPSVLDIRLAQRNRGSRS